MTRAKIATNQVVASLNAPKDDVTLLAGTNVVINVSTNSGANSITISARGGGGNFWSLTGNVASVSCATTSGGYANTASGFYATVSGGYDNTASGGREVVGGGQGNTAVGDSSTVAGGNGNTASFDFAPVGGGDGDSAMSFYAFVGGGQVGEWL